MQGSVATVEFAAPGVSRHSPLRHHHAVRGASPSFLTVSMIETGTRARIDPKDQLFGRVRTGVLLNQRTVRVAGTRTAAVDGRVYAVKGAEMESAWLLTARRLLVAGAGFEPATFGL